MSEKLALFAIILKFLEYLSTLLDSNWTTLSRSSLLNLFGNMVFLLSILLWLYSSNKRLEKVDAIAEEMKKINKLEWIAKYGFIGVLVSDLINLDKVRAHNIAGFQTISPIFSKLIPQSARDFYNLETGEQDQIQLRELHIVNPIELLEGNSTTHQPLCAIKFVTRGGMELDEMSICSAGATFDQFALNFKKEWDKADSIYTQ